MLLTMKMYRYLSHRMEDKNTYFKIAYRDDTRYAHDNRWSRLCPGTRLQRTGRGQGRSYNNHHTAFFEFT